MLRRTIALTLVLLLLAPAAALAQGGADPFQPLPPPQPTPAPTPEPPDDPFGDDLGGATTLYAIAGGLLVVFVIVGWFISRDARRTLPSEASGGRGRLRDQGPHKHERKAKAKARAKNRQARAARKTTKRRNRA
jgi:hypothetical protein